MYQSMHISEIQHRIAAAEDQNAFRELYLRMRRPLFRFAMSITRNHEASEEAVNDVFTRVWTNRKSLDHIHNLRLYLYTSIRNQSLNYLRSRKQLAIVSIDEMDISFEENVQSPEGLVETSELNKRLEWAVKSLPSRCKIIFKLVREDGLRYREVAELLHVQPKTVENQLTIATRKIAQAIEAYLQDFPGVHPVKRLHRK